MGTKYFTVSSSIKPAAAALVNTWFLGDLAESGSSAASTELLMRMQTRMKLPQ